MIQKLLLATMIDMRNFSMRELEFYFVYMLIVNDQTDLEIKGISIEPPAVKLGKDLCSNFDQFTSL